MRKSKLQKEFERMLDEKNAWLPAPGEKPAMPEMKRLIIKFRDVETQEQAIEKAKEVVETFPGSVFIGMSKAKNKSLYGIMHVPESLVGAVFSRFGETMTYGNLDDHPPFRIWDAAYGKDPAPEILEYMERHIADCEKCAGDKDWMIERVRKSEERTESRKKS